MDESGHSGDTGAAEGGDGGESRERTRVNGWATSDSPWSYQGPGAEPESEVPAWRRPGAESRAFPRNPAFPSSAVPASSAPAPSPAPAPPGFVDAGRTGAIPPSVSPESPAPRWDNRPRYSDLMSHLAPSSGVSAPEPETRPQSLSSSPPPVAQTSAPAHPGMTTGEIREPGLRTGDPLRSLRRFDVPTPNSAPPYPYEGDLDETPDAPPPPPITRQRSAVPMVRPAAPDARRPEWEGGEPARHALNTPAQGLPRVERVTPRPEAAAEEPEPSRPAYDPSSFPRRLSYESPTPAPYEPPAYEPPFAGFGTRSGETDSRGLPQRVPAQPDVPQVPEPPLVEPTAETPALARIATHLRRGDVLPAEERQEGFDVRAILAAVREVEGVRDASLRSTEAGAHSLRLDLAEGADPAEVSRQVARLLQDRMGLDAAMQGEGQPTPPRADSPAPAPVSPSALLPRARPQVPSASHAPTTSQAPAASALSSPTSASPTSAAPTPVSPARASTAPTSPAPPSRDSTAPTSPAWSSAAPAPSERASAAPTSPAWSSAAPTSPGRAPTTPASTDAAPTSPAWSSAEPSAAARASAESASPGRASAEPASSARAFPASGSTPPAARAEPRTPSPAPVSAPPDAPARDNTGTRPAAPARPVEAESRRSELSAQHARSESSETLEDAEVVPSGAECGPPRPLYPGEHPGPRVVIENVQVNTFGADATVEVKLAVGSRAASGVATGPAVDGYLLRLCAMATAGAVDELLSASDHPEGPARCFVEHAAAVPFGASQVAVVVLLLSCGGWVEQLAGSAVVTSDDRHAMVRATLAAVNRRLEALLTR
ncbi:hypothetical protein [Actinoplanes sp. NPDC048796]|uniref:hypothetical protein n=1 Tax=Actinoplanes sp. NPDC048796 TaxID=3155640 RepID=UPI0034113EBC